MQTQPLTIGVDDGYATTKVCMGNGRVPFAMPTRAQSGGNPIVAGGGVGGGDAPGTVTYEASGRRYTVGSSLDSPNAASSDEYPFSEMNRIVVAHALAMARVPKDVSLRVVTGLPVRRYYRSQAGAGATPNKRLINRKRHNLLHNDVVALRNGAPPMPTHKIVQHDVLPEGYGAWLNYVHDRDEHGRATLNRDRSGGPVAIIDIGGRTTDICVVRNGEIDMQRTRTVVHGTQDVEQGVRGRVENAHDGIQLTAAQLDSALRCGTVRMYGKDVDVKELRAAAVSDVFARIGDEVRAILGAAADIDAVVFVGGGAVVGRSEMATWFPHNAVFPEYPVMANAQGFQLYGALT